MGGVGGLTEGFSAFGPERQLDDATHYEIERDLENWKRTQPPGTRAT